MDGVPDGKNRDEYVGETVGEFVRGAGSMGEDGMADGDLFAVGMMLGMAVGVLLLNVDGSIDGKLVSLSVGFIEGS